MGSLEGVSAFGRLTGLLGTGGRLDWGLAGLLGTGGRLVGLLGTGGRLDWGLVGLLGTGGRLDWELVLGT